MSEETRQPLLKIDDLRIVFRAGNFTNVAVKRVSLSVGPGEAVGVVGESGSGKSTLARSILGLLPPKVARIEAGRMTFEGREISEAGRVALRGRHIAMVFQDPLSYLNPLMTVSQQIGEAVKLHDKGANTRKRTLELLDLVRLPSAILHAYPHELSGGMRQRVLISIALACRPKLLIADEPTTALDVTTQGEILDLINALRRDLGMALMLITHDLGAVAVTTEYINVMLRGEIVEYGPTKKILSSPVHEYTVGLLRSARGDRDENGNFLTMNSVASS